MTRNLLLAVAVALPSVSASAQPAADAAIPAHPDELRFEPIEYAPPNPADHRVELSNGMVVFIAEDLALPLIDVSLQLRVGSWLEPEGKAGLAGLTGAQMRRGGTASMTAEELDERLDFLAAQVSTGIGETGGFASLNCLSDNFDEALGVFVEMLREPRFQDSRLALAKEQSLQEMAKRNDESDAIERRELRRLLYGESFFVNRDATKASIESVTREDLAAFHRQWVHPRGAVLAVSGAFDRQAMLAKLEAAFAEWPNPAPEVPPIPSEIETAAPGLYMVEKDVNQGRVSLALPSVYWDSPDYHALEVMNDILGGSGFTSRITRTVRSDEGLAYSAGSGIRFGVHYPGSFRAGFQSKSRSVAYATSLVLEEIRRIREEPVTDEELDTIKRNLIETFPSRFASPAQSMGTFAGDEVAGRRPEFWTDYRDRIAAVTAADVQRVARDHVDPARLVILVVGQLEQIAAGDGEHDVSLSDLAGGEGTRIPLRDPMTLEPIAPEG
jgi:zinc protease